MKLVEAGRLGLDGPMVELLPSEATAGLHLLDGVDRTESHAAPNLRIEAR